jgi:hypothetical protein
MKTRKRKEKRKRDAGEKREGEKEWMDKRKLWRKNE